jgi:DNA-binding GntR family transcriptional regulator
MPDTETAAVIIKQPEPIRKQVYEHLRDHILNHTITPSSRLVEAKIAKELGISRTPVREALHLLEKDGFVESVPRIGYHVKKLDLDDLDEIFEIRLINETLACRWALYKIGAPGLKKLDKNIADTEAALEKNKPNLFLKYDEEFHEILFEASGSGHLNNLCQQLTRLMLRYRAESIKTAESIKGALAGHKRILKYLKEKDADGLQKELSDHLMYSRDDIRKKALSVIGK